MRTVTGYYPPWAFHYRVEFENSSTPDDARFQSVSGLSVEYETEEYAEGGENRYVHKLPVRTTYSDLVLTRGMFTGSETIAWFLEAFRDQVFSPRSLTVTLLNERSEPLRTWNVVHAIPKKWSISDLDAQESAVVIETLELTYRYFHVSPSPQASETRTA
ncbi:MAG: phage tail protein [Brachybacterium sp.]|nr:phage tail protein [Brachybacterium sp.]